MFHKRLIWIVSFIFFLACSGQKQTAEITRAKDLLDQNKPTEAQTVLENLEKGNQRDAEIQYLLGWVYFQKGRSTDALTKFGAAIKYDDAFFGGYNGMGALLMVQGNSPEALNYFKKAADRNPKSPEILANIAELNMQMGKADDAEEYLTKAKALAPQLGDYDFLLAQHYYRRGILEKATDLLKQGADLPFKKAILLTQIPCLQAGIETKTFEAKIKSAVIKPPYKTQYPQLMSLSKTFDACQKQDAGRFDYVAEKAKVETWLKQKKS